MSSPNLTIVLAVYSAALDLFKQLRPHPLGCPDFTEMSLRTALNRRERNDEAAQKAAKQLNLILLYRPGSLIPEHGIVAALLGTTKLPATAVLHSWDPASGPDETVTFVYKVSTKLEERVAALEKRENDLAVLYAQARELEAEYKRNLENARERQAAVRDLRMKCRSVGVSADKLPPIPWLKDDPVLGPLNDRIRAIYKQIQAIRATRVS